MQSLDPYELARRDVRRRAERFRDRVVDLAKTYSTAALLKTLGLTALGGAAAVYVLPVAAAVVMVAAMGALVVHAIYATQRLKAQDREARWLYIHGKRAQETALEAEIAIQTATLVLAGERADPRRIRASSAELRSALMLHQHRLRSAIERAELAEVVRDGIATTEQVRRKKTLDRVRRDVTPPKGPEVAPIAARRDARQAELDVLRAEIKALATADDTAAAMRADEVVGARRKQKERETAARHADQMARDRVRQRRDPVPRQSGSVLDIRIRPNGERDVNTSDGPATPEQVAAGEAAIPRRRSR